MVRDLCVVYNNWFKNEIVSLQLIRDDDFSKIICNLCDNDLEVFANFR